jgi:hypothetical protein
LEDLRTITITSRQRRFASVMTDVLVYTVVLNLFVEHAESVIIDSFSISILTAVVLKVILDLILAFEHQVSAFFTRFEGASAKVVRFLAVWGILFGSKFVILEVVDIVFGDHVDLGGFLMVIAIVLAMMIARQLVNRAYLALGEGETADAG